ncbi:MAG: YeeE/YedE family protein [Burkholderiales bacterium]
MTRIAYAFSCGVVFAIGLIVSGMTNPAKVVGFLDITGRWDPSLAFVMGGALAMFGFAYWRSRRPAARPLLDETFYVPEAQGIDGRLLIGSALFGLGWGLAGFCPGPAVVSAGFGDVRVWVFLAAMAASSAVVGRLNRR